MASVEGYIAPGYERVAEVFAASLESGDDLGAGFAAYRDGELVLDIWGGVADRTSNTAWSRDTIAPMFSTSKGISAIVAAWCVEQRLLRYDQRVSDLWPAFANGKEHLTVAQALSHQAGVPGFPEPIDPDLWLDPPALAAQLATLAPLWPPGAASGYHPMTWGYIASEIVQRASGRSLGSILREEICAPFGIDFHIGLPDSEHHRCPEIVKPRRFADFGEITPIKRAAFLTAWAAPKRNTAEWRRLELPSHNGHGTARAAAQLYGVLANEGALEGMQLLSSDTFAQLTQPRIAGRDLVLPFDLDWRSGLLGNAQFFYGPNRGALGHSGSGGSFGFGDPEARVSAGYVMNKQSHHLMGDPRALRLIDALYACIRA